jgi:hypothetical protein
VVEPREVTVESKHMARMNTHCFEHTVRQREAAIEGREMRSG